MNGSGRLAGRCAVVTGAASGIGEQVVRAFLREGANVLAVDRDESRLALLQADAQAGRLLTAACDVADEDSVARTAARAVHEFSSIDVLVTAAGISVGGTATDTSLATWESVMRVNLTGTFLWVRACLPTMVAQGRGSIITVASQRAVAGGDGNASYVASKGAVLSFTRGVALDYAPDGVRANALLPGAIDTGMLRTSFTRTANEEAARARSIARHPMRRFGRPQEVADAAVFLGSDESAFITGIDLPVDGGWLAA